MMIIPDKPVHVVRADKLGAVRLHDPIVAVDERVLIGSAEFVGRHVIKHSLQVVRWSDAFREFAPLNHSVPHILEYTYRQLEPLLGFLMLRSAIVRVLLRKILDTSSIW